MSVVRRLGLHRDYRDLGLRAFHGPPRTGARETEAEKSIGGLSGAPDRSRAQRCILSSSEGF